MSYRPKIKQNASGTLVDLALDAETVKGVDVVGAINGIKDGSTIDSFSDVETALAGKQPTIDSSHKLSSDLVDDTNKTHKFVSASEKTTWNGKQDTLTTQTAYLEKGSATKVPQITTNSLGQVTTITEKTITAVRYDTSSQSLTDTQKSNARTNIGAEDKSNKITSFSGSETNEQYPSALLVATTLNAIAELAEGKTKNYVISDATTGTNIVNTSFNSTSDTVAITFANKSIKDVENNTISLADLKIGDIISITETNVPDRWVGSITSTTITFYKLETKIDIDSTPTQSSTNPVSSGGVYTALSGKQATIDSSHKLAASLVSGLATVATSGSYNDLSNKPSIPSSASSTSTVTPTTVTLRFTYEDETYEDITVMTGASVSTTTTLS